MASTDYIHLFETVAEFNEEYNGEDYHEPWVSYTIESSGVSYNKQPVTYTMNLYVWPHDASMYEFSQSTWVEVTNGTPVAVETFSSVDELFEYNFQKTSAFTENGVDFLFGTCEYEQGVGYFGFVNNFTKTSQIRYNEEWSGRNYITLESMYSDYKNIVSEYFSTNRNINIVYAPKNIW